MRADEHDLPLGIHFINFVHKTHERNKCEDIKFFKELTYLTSIFKSSIIQTVLSTAT